MFSKKINNITILVEVGNITKSDVHAIINWTRGNLKEGDDKLREIHLEGGSVIYKDCQSALDLYSPDRVDLAIQTGRSIITRSGILPCKRVIHCVLPFHKIKVERENRQVLLKECISGIFLLTKMWTEQKEALRKIALTPPTPVIYGDNLQEIAQITIQTLLETIQNSDNNYLRTITILCDNENELNLYKRMIYIYTTSTIQRIFYIIKDFIQTFFKRKEIEVSSDYFK
jgi:O-acetyl-ADP-ribose deacetylase (regulator of RNase III)